MKRLMNQYLVFRRGLVDGGDWGLICVKVGHRFGGATPNQL